MPPSLPTQNDPSVAPGSDEYNPELLEERLQLPSDLLQEFSVCGYGAQFAGELHELVIGSSLVEHHQVFLIVPVVAKSCGLQAELVVLLVQQFLLDKELKCHCSAQRNGYSCLASPKLR